VRDAARAARARIAGVSRFVRALALALLTASGAFAAGTALEPVTVVFVRHAETAGPTRGGGDPPLSDAGRARAATLARALADSAVTHLFTSQALRCRDTLGPLAATFGLVPTTIPAGETERQIGALRALPPGSLAVVAGHSNTIPQLVTALGGEMGGLVDDPQYGRVIRDADYGRMVVVVLGGDGIAAASIELRYGTDPAEPTQSHRPP
jgi:phosphohistidine phosphatase SixA